MFKSDIVIPANAGVILKNELVTMKSESYPRECGGDPLKEESYMFKLKLSPRMRG